MTPRKIYQLVVIPAGGGAVIYCRRDDGRVFRCFDRFDAYDSGGEQGEWVEIKLPPGVKPSFTGDNGGPEF